MIIFNLQCVASFVGNGEICGKDSDGDGYPDMQLNCNESHCVQVCTYVHMFLCSISCTVTYVHILSYIYEHLSIISITPYVLQSNLLEYNY